MNKYFQILLVLCVLLSGCSNPQEDPTQSSTVKPEAELLETIPSYTTVADATATIYPLPDSTISTIDNATIAISLEEGDAYVDDTGVMRMDVMVYSYDLYDMVDISGMKPGDIIVTHSGEVEITSVERNELGTIFINGGLDNGGFDLFGNDEGVYYEIGFSDTKNWYEIGEVTLRVSPDLIFTDTADLDKGEQIYYAGSFLVGEVTDYHFTPHNTTIRTENGQIVSIERIYTP